MVNWTQLGGARTSLTCLVRGHLISTRTIRNPAPRHVCCRAPRGVGCPFRMTSCDEENSGPDFLPAYGVQLHDQRLLEYIGAPESAWLLSRSPEYWVHHMGREKTLSAALQLQHDAGLILSNVQVLQQLVTALNRTSSDVLRAVHGRRPFPTNAMHQVMPSYRVRRAAHYMTAMSLWRPPIAPAIRGPLPLATCNACMSCSECFPDVLL